MQLPLKQKITVTSGFRTSARPNHTGTDLVSSTDTKVYAVEAGVAKQRYDSISGYGVNLHVGLKKYEYLHLNKSGRASGAVKEGAVLGNYKPGSGKVSGPHLHLGLQIPTFGPQINPWTYINKRLRQNKRVRKHEGAKDLAKRAGYPDWEKESRWTAIAKLNGYKTWKAFNEGIKRFQLVRVK